MKALFFLALLSLVIPVAVIIKIHFWILSIQPFMLNDFALVRAEISSISMEKGKLVVEPRKGKSIPKNGIYTIRDAQKNIIAIINPENMTIPDNLGGAKYYMSSREIALRMDGKVERMSIIKNFSTSLDSEMYDIASGKGTTSFFIGIYPLMSMSLFVILLFMGLVFTFPAWGTMRFFELKLKFHKLLSISIVAMTPAVVLFFLSVFIFNQMFLDIVYIALITIIYLYFAFKKIAQEEDEVEEKSVKKVRK